MEIRKEEEVEKEEEIEEEKEEEEKEDSQEDEKDSNKISNTVNYSPKNISLKIQNENKPKEEEEEKISNNYKQETPIKTTKIEKEENTPENQDQDLEATSTYILKYTRKGDELEELAEETGLRKTENCLFMLNIKLIKSDSVSIIDPTEEGKEQEETPKEPENFLVFCCHEIAAIYFDEIYERIYTLKDLALENKYFKVFESTEEAKIVIDETIRTNEKNAKKIFIGFKDKELKLHMKLSFFDKEKEIIINIPKKILTDKDKNNLLPEFLKEIQDKMNHLKDENKKLKAKKIVVDSSHGTSDFLIETDSKKEVEIKNKPVEENNEIKEVKENNNNIETKNVKKKIVKKKIKKKTGKEKKVLLPEENFF